MVSTTMVHLSSAHCHGSKVRQSQASPEEAKSKKVPKEVKREKSEIIVTLLISSQPPHPLRRTAQVSVNIAEENPRDGKMSDLAYS